MTCGLPDDSRVVKAQNKSKADVETMLLAAMVDELNMIIWLLGNGNKNNIPVPDSVLDIVVGRTAKDSGDYEIYDSSDAFEESWARITGA